MNKLIFGQSFPFIAELEPVLQQEFLASCHLQYIKEGQHLADSGTACQFMMFVSTGCIKVYTLSNEGREITLFRVKGGGGCIMSAACILSGRPFPAMAMAEENVTALAVPGSQFASFFARSDVLRRYVMGMFADRFELLTSLLEDVTFNPMNKRLAKFLLKTGARNTIEITHEAIALELGTAREVVSRLLSDFQKKGFVRLARGEIVILDSEALSLLVAS